MNKNGNRSIVSAAWVWKQFYQSILISLAKSQTLLDIYKSIKEVISFSQMKYGKALH